MEEPEIPRTRSRAPPSPTHLRYDYISAVNVNVLIHVIKCKNFNKFLFFITQKNHTDANITHYCTC